MHMDQVKIQVINGNKYEPKLSIERKKRYLDFLNDPSFQGVNRLFALPFENEAQRKSYKRCYLPTTKIKNFKYLVDVLNFFDQPIRNNLITYDNIQKIATGQGDDYQIGFFLDYNYFTNYYKIVAIDLSKRQALADPKAIQQINFTGNIVQQETIFFIIEEAKETILYFSQGTVKVL